MWTRYEILHATEYLTAGLGRRSAVEYVYHALHLPNFADLLRPAATANFATSTGTRRTDLLEDKDIRGSVQAAIEEFPIAAQLWLDSRGLRVPDSVRALASRDQQHASVAAQVENLLPYGESARQDAEQIFAVAYENLRDDGDGLRSSARSVLGRADRGASPVFRAGARLAAQRGDEESALKLIGQGLERATRDGAADLTLGLLKERAWLLRNRPADKQADGLALLGEHEGGAGRGALRDAQATATAGHPADVRRLAARRPAAP